VLEKSVLENLRRILAARTIHGNRDREIADLDGRVGSGLQIDVPIERNAVMVNVCRTVSGLSGAALR
jgi:hypothetical protein